LRTVKVLDVLSINNVEILMCFHCFDLHILLCFSCRAEQYCTKQSD